METTNSISKIGVISDTHIPSRAKFLPPSVFTLFEGVDMIIHCGDIVVSDVIIELSTIAHVEAVKGNMDPYDINLPYDKILKINNCFTLCITHGTGSKYGLKQRLYSKFKDYSPDMIIYGHSHVPDNSELNGIKFFNPGSPVSGEQINTAGLLYLNNLNLKGEIIEI